MLDINKSELRKFGLIMAAVICCLFGLLIPWLFDRHIPTWPWILASLFVLPALLYPQSLKPVYGLWMKFGHVMGWINTRIILGLVFYTVFFPIGLFMKLIGRDSLNRKFLPNQTSYRIKRSQPIKPDDMETPF